MRRAGRILAVAVGVAVVVLALAQLFLPGIAARRISSRLSRYGSVHSVHVSAWPAIELLWGHADSVSVHVGQLRLSPAHSAKLLSEARRLGTVHVTADTVREGPLRLTEVALDKRGDAVSAHATASEGDVHAALPAGVTVRLLESHAGEVEVQASGALFGVSATIEARAAATEGRLVLHPVAFPFEGLQLTLFADPHVYVEGVGASPARARDGSAGYRLSISGRLR